MYLRKFTLAVAIFSTALSAGCRTGLLGGDEPVAPAQPAAPAAPIVVDGVRTSYADVVERTSPAVVRIEAEQRGRSQSQTQFQVPFGDDLFRQGPNQQPPSQQGPRVERGVGS